MDAPTYSPKKLAELLQVPVRVLQGVSKKESYSTEDLFALRQKLDKNPAPLGPRKQLFLNFKGGTGKTSISTSYSYRLD